MTVALIQLLTGIITGSAVSATIVWAFTRMSNLKAHEFFVSKFLEYAKQLIESPEVPKSISQPFLELAPFIQDKELAIRIVKMPFDLLPDLNDEESAIIRAFSEESLRLYSQTVMSLVMALSYVAPHRAGSQFRRRLFDFMSDRRTAVREVKVVRSLLPDALPCAA